MKVTSIGRYVAAASCAALTLGGLGGFAAQSASGQSSAGKTLVIDNVFEIDYLDPGREFDLTSELVDYACYDTLLTVSPGSQNPVPNLATSYQVLDGARKYVFHLNPKARFSDGNPVTSADVVWSLNRMVNLAGNPSFLLAGETITADGPETVVFTSAQPNPQLPAILPNPATAAVEESVVTAHGGTDAKNAATADKAASWLNEHSAGSGPYVLASYTTNSQVVLKPNPNYWGPKPSWGEVVIRNVQASEQGLDVQRGQYEVGLDMAPSQVTSLSGVHIISEASPNLWFLFNNDSPSASGGITNNHDFQQAVRYALNYQSLVTIAGKGAIQAAGVVPTQYAGALPASADVKTNLSLAKQYLAKSGLKNPTVKLYYASDIQQNGVSPGTVAAVVQQDLQAVGITVQLEPQSITIALNGYRKGTEQMGLWFWEPDYADAADYLAFAPGHLVGLRAGFTASVSPSIVALANKAAVATGSSRAAAYQQYQKAMNAGGPFVPLMQTAQVLVATKNLTNLSENALWFVDLRNLG